MRRTAICLTLIFGCSLAIGCSGNNDGELMPEPSADAAQERMDYEMDQEAEMEAPDNR